jgi:hypothetical protein
MKVVSVTGCTLVDFTVLAGITAKIRFGHPACWKGRLAEDFQDGEGGISGLRCVFGFEGGIVRRGCGAMFVGGVNASRAVFKEGFAAGFAVVVWCGA